VRFSALQVRRQFAGTLVVSTADRGTIRLRVPAARRSEEWTIEAAVVVGDVNGDGVPDIAVAVDHFNPSAAVTRGRCNPLPPQPKHDDFVQVIFGGPLPTMIDLAHVTVPGFRINTPPGTSAFGSALAGVGDVNRDGLTDLLIGAPGDVDQPGRAYVVYGKASTSSVDVSSLGDRGFALTGPTDGRIYQAGMVVEGGGDVNGDGRPDLLIGAQWRTAVRVQQLKASQCGDAIMIPPPHSARSVVYVVFGGARAGTVDLGALGSSGFTVGDSWKLEDVAGRWLANAGDVNGDGLADVLIGTRAGAMIVYGRRATTAVNPDTLGDGGTMVDAPWPTRVTPITRSVAGIGDLNGDRLADVAVSAGTGGEDFPVGSKQAEAPSAYVIFGSRASAPIDVTKLGAHGFAIDGTRDNAGSSLAALGDLNGDGVPDFGVLAPSTPYGGRFGSGSLYTLFGKRSPNPLRLDALGPAGVRVDGSPNTSIYESGGAGKLTGSGRTFVLVDNGESAELVPFTPHVAAPAPRLGPTLSLRPRFVTGLAHGFGRVWLLAESGNHAHGLVYQLNPQTNRLVGAPVQIGGPSRVIATALDSLWTLVVPPHRDRPATLVRIDPNNGKILLRAQVGGRGRDIDQVIPADTISEGFGSLWITYAATGSVYRLDPQTGKTIAAIKVGHYPQALTFAAGKVWVADRQDGAIREIDPTSNRVVGAPLDVSREPISQGRALGDMLWIGTTNDATIWVYDPNHDQVAHLDPRTRRLRFDPPSAANGEIAVAAGPLLWIIGDRSASRVRVADGQMVGSRVELDSEPLGATATASSVWTTTQDGGVIRINR